MPKNSFAIQLKSDKRAFDFSKHIQYLYDLEIPFFVGVVDQKQLRLHIYAGEYIPIFLCYRSPEKLKIELCEDLNPKEYFREFTQGGYTLKFPKIIEIGADDNQDNLEEKVTVLSEVTSLMHKNISSKKNNEFIFQTYGPLSQVFILAGPGSAQVFRDNFKKRLAEVFFNLHWIYEERKEEFEEEEYKAYERIYDELEALYGELPDYLTDRFALLKRQIDSYMAKPIPR